MKGNWEFYLIVSHYILNCHLVPKVSILSYEKTFSPQTEEEEEGRVYSGWTDYHPHVETEFEHFSITILNALGIFKWG